LKEQEMGCIVIFVVVGLFVLVFGGIGAGSYWVLTEVFAVSDADATEASSCIVVALIGLSLIGTLIAEEF
jgi:hypothetical protein